MDTDQNRADVVELDEWHEITGSRAETLSSLRKRPRHGLHGCALATEQLDQAHPVDRALLAETLSLLMPDQSRGEHSSHGEEV